MKYLFILSQSVCSSSFIDYKTKHICYAASCLVTITTYVVNWARNKEKSISNTIFCYRSNITYFSHFYCTFYGRAGLGKEWNSSSHFKLTLFILSWLPQNSLNIQPTTLIFTIFTIYLEWFSDKKFYLPDKASYQKTKNTQI